MVVARARARDHEQPKPSYTKPVFFLGFWNIFQTKQNDYTIYNFVLFPRDHHQSDGGRARARATKNNQNPLIEQICVPWLLEIVSKQNRTFYTI